MSAWLYKMSCKEKMRGMGEEEAMQITGTPQSSCLSELKIFFSLLFPLMRTEKPHISRSSSHIYSRLAPQDTTFLKVEVGVCFLGAVLSQRAYFGQVDHGNRSWLWFS